MNQHLTKEDIQLATDHMKRCAMADVIRELQMNKTM